MCRILSDDDKIKRMAASIHYLYGDIGARVDIS